MTSEEKKRKYKAEWNRRRRLEDPLFVEKNRLSCEKYRNKKKASKIYINPIDISGVKYGRLMVIGLSKNYSGSGITLWDCVCECGNRLEVFRNYLKSGQVKSCGCLKKGVNKIHGESHRSKEYTCWSSLKTRCLNKNAKSYKDYGAKGIKVCERWLNSYTNFLSDMGRAPSRSHSIERVKTSGDYEPSNCKWGTRKEQSNNRTSNIYISFKRKKKSLSEWAEELHIPYFKFHYLITRSKKSMKEIVANAAVYAK